MGLALLLRALSKFRPLLEEVILNDKTLMEYLKSNKYHLFLLAIVFTLAIALINARQRAHVVESSNTIGQPSIVLDKAVESTMELIHNRPIDPNDSIPKPEDDVVLPRKETPLRKLIKDRLLEN